MDKGDGVADAKMPTSSWLVPAEPKRAWLHTNIDQLPLECSSPSFEPHITLIAALVGDRQGGRVRR
jgi:hypothetical protein